MEILVSVVRFIGTLNIFLVSFSLTALFDKKKKETDSVQMSRSDEGLTLQTSAFSLFTVANLRFRLSC